MKKCLLLTGLFLLSLITTEKVLAQGSVPSFSIDTVLHFPDTAHTDSAYNFSFVVKNVSNSPYSGGVVSIRFAVQPVLGDTGIFAVDQPANVQPGDTFVIQALQFQFNVNSSLFSVGDNVVVVWPLVDNGNGETADSIMLDVYIPDPASLPELQGGANKLSIFPNPASGQLRISSPPLEKEFEQVRIYDLTGKLMYSAPYRQRQLSVSGLPEGVYFLEIELANRKAIRKKFIIQRE